MKKLLVTLALIAGISFQTMSQVVKSTPTKAELMEKSKKQKKTGLIMLGGGLLVGIGGTIAVTSATNSIEGGAVAFILGAGSVVGGIGFLIASSHNQDRAEELSFGPTRIDLPKGTYSGPPAFPSLSLSIPISGRKEKSSSD